MVVTIEHYLRKTQFALPIWLLWFGLFVAAVSSCNMGEVQPIEHSAKLQASPRALVFEAITLGQSLERTIVIQNVGEKVVTIDALSTVNESSSHVFTLIHPKSSSLQLKPKSSIRLTVRYEPKKAGSASGHLQLRSNATNADKEGIFRVKLRSSTLSPALSMAPNPLNFGVLKPEQIVQKTLTVTNYGSVHSVIHKVTLEHNPLDEFVMLTDLELPMKLAPGKSTSITFSYTPKQLLSESYIVLHNNSESSKRTVRLLGQIATPKIAVQPKSLSFVGPVGELQRKKLVIYNLGRVPLQVKGVKLEQASSKEFLLLELPTFPLQVEPGRFVAMEVGYLADDAKLDSGTVVVESNDPYAPNVKLILTGKSVGCYLQAFPPKLHFTQKGTKKVSIANQGNQTCEFKGVYLGEKSSRDFALVHPIIPARKVGPGQTLIFQVRFYPRDFGTDDGTLVFVSGETTRRLLRVPLTANIRANTPCYIRAKPSQLFFGHVDEGKTKQLPITISNSGNDDCSINHTKVVSSSGNAFQMVSALPSSGQVIKAGESIQMMVSFSPKQDVSYQGSIQFTSTDTRVQPFLVKLLGERSRLCLEVVHNALHFGSSKVGCSVGKRSVVVYNLCNVDVTVGSIRLDKVNPNREFSIQSAESTPVVLKSSQFTTIQLMYLPKDVGTDNESLRVTNADYSAKDLVIPLTGHGVDTDEQTDTFHQNQHSQIDILFVVDNSCSMRNDQVNLSNNLRPFVQWAARLQLDYHIGVATTDIRNKGCLVGTDKIVTAQTPNLMATLSKNVSVGTAGSGAERGLESSRLALTEPTLSGCNQGFYRKDATLSIVYISDEPDYSNQPVDYYVSFLRSLKGTLTPEKLRVSAIGPFSEAICQSTGRCRYYLAAKMFKGVYSHITSTSWGSTLSNLGSLTFGSFSQYFLSRPASPGSLYVKIDDKVIPEGTEGWTYNATNNSIRFANTITPATNAVITISYKAMCFRP